jgi:hypothetical protein
MEALTTYLVKAFVWHASEITVVARLRLLRMVLATLIMPR